MKRFVAPSGAASPMPNRLTLLIAGTAVLGVALVLAREATFGVWLHGDSPEYITMARSLLAGHLSDYDGAAITLHPPGYPLLLAAASLGVFDPYEVAGPLNAALFGLTIFVTGRYLHGRLRLRPLAVWAGLAMALAAPLASMAAWAMSDPAFILLAVLALVRTDDYLAEGRTASLAWAALFAALAWQTRYVGAVVPVVVGLAVLLLQPGATRWQRVLRASFVWLVAVLLMAPWMARNYLAIGGRPYTLEETVKAIVRGHPTHGRPFPLDEILAQVGSGLESWASFGPSPLGWPSLALLAVAALVLVWAGSRLVHGPRMPRVSCGWRTFSVWGGFVLAYLVLLAVLLVDGNTNHGVEERYLAPVYVSCLVVVVFVVDRLLGPDRGGKRSGGVGALSGLGRFGRVGASLPSVVVAAGLALWLAANADRSLSEILRANRGEMDLHHYRNGPRRAESGTLRYIRDNPIDGLVYSNDWLPTVIHNRGTAAYPRPTDWKERWLGDDATVVWFRNPYGRGAGAASLLVSPELTLLAELDDGLIFRLDNRPAFDVELTGKTLTYRKAPCAPKDVRAPFILKVRPVNAGDMPAHRSGKPYDLLGFDFGEHGVIRDGECRATVTLPDYDVEYVQTGQFKGSWLPWSAVLADGDTIKGVRTSPRPNPYREARAAIAAGDFGAPVRPPANEGASEGSNAFDLYFRDGTLAYLKEPCAAGDTAALFFLHVFPADPADVLAYRRRRHFDGRIFDNRDFRFKDFGIRFDSPWGRTWTCLALVRLPGYGIASFSTGQFVPGGSQIWKVELDRNRQRRMARYRQVDASIAAGELGAPAARSIFEVWPDGPRLIYRKAQCTAEDTEAWFFLHLFPADPADLPADRREYGFDNQDHLFPDHGAILDDTCLAIVPLPDFEVARIRTGQYVSGAGAVWKVELERP